MLLLALTVNNGQDCFSSQLAMAFGDSLEQTCDWLAQLWTREIELDSFEEEQCLFKGKAFFIQMVQYKLCLLHV